MELAYCDSMHGLPAYTLGNFLVNLFERLQCRTGAGWYTTCNFIYDVKIST